MIGPAAAGLLFLAALTAPFLSGGIGTWVPWAFYPLLALSFLAGLRPGLSGTAFPRLWNASFAAAFLLGLLHLARMRLPQESLSFLLQLGWAFLFLHLALRHLDDRRWGWLFAAWTAGEALLVGLSFLGGQGGRASGGFENANLMGGFFAASLGWFVGRLTTPPLREGKGMREAGSWTGAVVATAGLLSSGSRSALLAAFLLWGVAVLAGRGWRRWAAAAALGGLLLLPNLASERLSAGEGGDPYAYTRREIWRAGLEMGARHPLVGVGPNLYGFATLEEQFPLEGGVSRFGRVARGPHSELIRGWAEGGAAGVAVMGLFLLPLLAGLPRLVREGRWGRALPLGAVAFTALFHDLSFSPSMVFLGLACAALALPPPNAPPSRLGEGRGGRWWLLPAGLGIALALLLQGAELAGNARWNRGRELAAADPAAASSHYIGALAVDPLHPSAARDLGSALLRLAQGAGGEPLEGAAEAALRRAARLNRLDPSPPGLLGRLRLLQAERSGDGGDGLLREAGEGFSAALELNPHGVFDMALLARVRERQGDRAAALALLDRALADEPNFIAGHRQRIRLLMEGEDPAGVAVARKALQEAQVRLQGKVIHPGYEAALTSDQHLFTTKDTKDTKGHEGNH